MKLVRTIAWTGALWLGIASTVVCGQIIKQIPASALVVLKVTNLDATSKKLGTYAQNLGISQMDPDMAMPLDSLLRQLNISEGINRAGDAAGMFIDPAVSNAPEEKSQLLLVPISDFQKFIGNFPDAKPDGDLTQVSFGKPAPQPVWVAHWGDYAALSPVRQIVAKPPTDILQVDGLTAKELDGKDAVIVGNLKALRPKMLAAIDEARQKMSTEIDQMMSQIPAQQGKDYQKFAPLAKQLANQFLDAAQQFAQSADAASFSINLSPDGIASTLMCQFDPASSWGIDVAAVKNTDASMLAGLGAGKYMLYGGANPQGIAHFWNKYLPPLEQAVTNLGPDYAPLNDFLGAIQKMSTAVTDYSFGMPMQSAPGAGAMFQMVSITRGDAKTLLDCQRQAFTAEFASFKILGVQTNGMQTTYTQAGKTVDGIAFDEMKGQFNMDAQNNPMANQIKEFMKMFWGPGGMDTLSGIVNDHTLLTVQGMDDASISSAITAAKAGDDPLAKPAPLNSVASQLPAQRFAVVYVPLDLWVATGLNVAKTVGIDMGVVLPDNLPPMGLTLSTDSSAVRGDCYMPAQLLQALTAAGMQIYMKTQNIGAQPQNNNGGAAPGGM